MFVISIRKFLSKYYNIQGSNFNSLTHKDISEMCGVFPCLYGNVIKESDLNDIKSGHILLVIDCENNVLGYTNPLLEKDNEECEELFNHPIIVAFYEKLEHETGLKKEDIEHLKMYELEELLKKSKKTFDDRTKSLVIREFHRRKFYENNTKEQKLEKIKKREYKMKMI